MKAGGNMKRYFDYRVVLSLLLLCFTFNANAQDIQAEAQLGKFSIPIGDQTILRISAHMPVKTDITFPQVVDSIGKVKIVKTAKPDTALDKDNKSLETITHTYTITCFDTGVYVLPQFTLHTKTGDIKTGTVTLQVTSVKVDTTKAFYDIKQPLAVSYTFWDWLKDHWVAVVITLVIILLIAGIIYLYKNRPKHLPIINAAPIVLADDVIALNKLNALRDKKLWQQNEVKLYYIELTDILREYLEKRYRITAHEQTTDEIFDSLIRKELSSDSRNLLKQILKLADLVKFAKEKPAAFENEQSMENAISFIEQTRPIVKPVENKEDLPK